MGMAASQARFLGLTARKTNVEYEGQQINQQRTTLSNQSANYYNSLLGMSVPVPPSVSDYTKTVYTFKDGSLSNSISSMIAQADGSYLISYTSSWTDDFAVVAAGSSIVTEKEIAGEGYTYKNTVASSYKADEYEFKKQTDGTYNLINKKTQQVIASGLTLKEGQYTSADGNFTYATQDGKINQVYNNVYTAYDKSGNVITNSASKINEDGKDKYIVHNVGAKELRALGAIQVDSEGNYIGNDEYLKTLSPDQLKNLLEEENNYIKMLNEQYGQGDWMVRYVQNTTTGDWSPYFYKKDVLDSAIYSDTGSSQSNIPAYTVGAAQKNEEVKGVNARLEQDATGRIINITLNPGKADEVTYAVTTNTVTDQAAYDDAMNQYEYDKYQYDQSIQEINAKIEITQAQDKNLELRLKQLDTEQDAISTEMDAVQKVIEKNTESTFKTFG